LGYRVTHVLDVAKFVTSEGGKLMRILVAGASGMVGQGVVQACLDAPGVTRLATLARRPSTRVAGRWTDQPVNAVEEIVAADFHDLAMVEAQLSRFDACFYCAGAAPIGTREAEYRRVTVEVTCHVARTLGAHNPALRFLYVSGLGADPRSRLMPMRIKGEAELALAALPIRSICLRPGGIQPVQGVRSPHPALAMFYRVGGSLMGLGLPLMPGLLTSTSRLGRAMLALARMLEPPAFVENRSINELGSSGATL